MTAKPLSLGVLSRDPLQQRTLRKLLEQSGYGVASSFLLNEVQKNDALQQDIVSLPLDGWLVAAEVAEGDVEPLWVENSDWLASLQGIVIFCDEPVPGVYDPTYSSWERRLSRKLDQLAGKVNLAQGQQGRAKELWVLAASTGGPAAVKEFLQELPPNLGLGFIYVQHIDAGYAETLTQVFSQGCHYPAYPVQHGTVVRANALAIIPSDRATELLPNGTFVVGEQAWAGRYNPSIDCIVANVAQSHGGRSGVIVFTGMGDDGAMSCRFMRKSGGRVWAQSPESCTVDAMPLAAMATGCVEFAGTPRALAHQLVQTVKKGSALFRMPEAKIGASHE